MFDRYGKIVLKPRAACGSRGVRVLSSWPVLQGWLGEEFTPGTHLCEEFVDAPLCHVDAVVRDGEPVWDVSVYARDTVALRHGLPLSSATVADPAVRTAAGAPPRRRSSTPGGCARACCTWRRSPPGERLTFCEVAARPGGAGVTEAFRATNGVDLRHAKILADAGEDPPAGRRDPVAAARRLDGALLRRRTAAGVRRLGASPRTPTHAPCTPASATPSPRRRFSGSGVSTHVFVHDSHTEVYRLLARAERGIRVVWHRPGRRRGAAVVLGFLGGAGKDSVTREVRSRPAGIAAPATLRTHRPGRGVPPAARTGRLRRPARRQPDRAAARPHPRAVGLLATPVYPVPGALLEPWTTSPGTHSGRPSSWRLPPAADHAAPAPPATSCARSCARSAGGPRPPTSPPPPRT